MFLFFFRKKNENTIQIEFKDLWRENRDEIPGVETKQMNKKRKKKKKRLIIASTLATPFKD